MSKQKTFFSNIFDIENRDLYHAVNDLIDDANSQSTYYFLLILSSIIVAAGLLLANSAILIGGMLVTPVLNPILLVALSITTAKPNLLRRTSILIFKSVLVIMAISFIAGLIFGVPSDTAFFDTTLFNNSLRAAFLYFIVAFVSGIAATYSWVRKDVSDILPGISIAVSLVPPVAMIAIWISALDLERMRFFLLVFLFNLFGIIMGSLIIFSLLKVYKSSGMITSKVDMIIAEEEIRKKENAIKKASETIIET